MIILDTNVVSEPLQPEPSGAVLHWLDRQAPASLYLTAISLAELLTGIETLPAGKRRSWLQRAMVSEVLPLFKGRILTFGQSAADAFARIVASALAAGNAIDFADGAIAAIAMEHNFLLATRNERDFRGAGIELVNPWMSRVK
jgi:predicted nucleic acid-binding protein